MTVPYGWLLTGQLACAARQTIVTPICTYPFRVSQQLDWQLLLSRLVVLAAPVLLILSGVP